MAAAVQPLLDAVGSAMEAILVTVHDEDFFSQSVVDRHSMTLFTIS